MPGRKYLASEEAYRYGFHGKENDNEVKGEGNNVDFGSRVFDTRIGRWLSVDPLQNKYAGLSPYNFVANNPLIFIDPDGKIIKLTGRIEDQKAFVAQLQTLTGLQLELINGEVKLMAAGNSDPAINNPLKDIVLSLIDEKGKHYSNNVPFNLVNGKNGFKSNFLEKTLTSDDIPFDQFGTGAYDLQDVTALLNSDKGALEILLTHVLSERANVKSGDYAALLKKLEGTDLSKADKVKELLAEFDNAHFKGVIDETKAASNLFTDPDGRPVSLALRVEEDKFIETLERNLRGDKTNSGKTEYDYKQVKLIIFNSTTNENEITGAEIKATNKDVKRKP